MDHSDNFLSGFYDPSYSDDTFISQNHLGSPVDIPCDLPGYHPFPNTKASKVHYCDNFYYAPSTYPLTTTSIHDKQSRRPLSNTNNAWSSHSFDCVLDSPVVTSNVTLTPSTELSPIVSDAPFVPGDIGHGPYPGRKGDLLSPLNGFRLQNLPHSHLPPSPMSQGFKERSRDSGSNCFSPDLLSPPDSPASPASPPYLSYHEPWMNSPASVTTDTDDDSSLASSISSLSPDAFDHDFGEIPDEDEDFYSPSPRSESIYQPLEQYPLRTSSHSGHDERFRNEDHLDDDNLSPLTFSPPSLASLHILSPAESEHQSTSALNIKTSSTYIPPHDYNSFFEYDPSTPVPCSPSLRRPSTLPELEPTTFDADPFGLHKSLPAEAPTSLPLLPLHDIDMDMPDPHWCSLPGCETDDDLIPMELASKNYIPDPSAIVPTTSTGIRSLLLWDHGHNPDRSDIPTPRSPSPENFYLDPTVLAECDDEELHKVYELRQRTAKSEKWERERCRELSALLRLKLDERGVLGSGGVGGNDCGNHKNGVRSGCSNLSFSSPSTSDSLTVYRPQPRFPSSSSSSSPSPLSSSNQDSLFIPSSSSPGSALLPTLGKPQAQSEAPKHKIRSMAQLVASMIFHRQKDALSRHLTKKARFTPTQTYSHSSSTTGGAKVLPTPRSRLSKVILPEELEVDKEEGGQGAGEEVESGDEAGDEDEDLHLDVGGRPMSHIDMDLDKRECENSSSSHGVTWAAPLCTVPSTQ